MNGVGNGGATGTATGTGTPAAASKLAERKRATNHKAAELARQKAKANGIATTPAEEADGNSVMAREARERAAAIEVRRLLRARR